MKNEQFNREKQFEKKVEKRFEKVCKRALYGFIHFLFGVVFIAAFGWVVMLLWNALIPDIFGLAEIGYWQAFGLFALCRLLFGGFHWGCHSRHHGKRRKHAHHARKMQKMNHFHEKWATMTPEQQQAFIQKRHCHHRHGRRAQNTENQQDSDK